MSNKPRVDSRAELVGTTVLFNCICASQHEVHLHPDEPKEHVCTVCDTQWVIKTDTKIRKTTRQINKELGYDINND